jgi:hypothetical protein
MVRIGHQVRKRKLVQPVCIKTIRHEMVGGKNNSGRIVALLEKYFTNRGVLFSTIRRHWGAEIFISEGCLENC